MSDEIKPIEKLSLFDESKAAIEGKKNFREIIKRGVKRKMNKSSKNVGIVRERERERVTL